LVFMSWTSRVCASGTRALAVEVFRELCDATTPPPAVECPIEYAPGDVCDLDRSARFLALKGGGTHDAICTRKELGLSKTKMPTANQYLLYSTGSCNATIVNNGQATMWPHTSDSKWACSQSQRRKCFCFSSFLSVLDIADPRTIPLHCLIVPSSSRLLICFYLVHMAIHDSTTLRHEHLKQVLLLTKDFRSTIDACATRQSSQHSPQLLPMAASPSSPVGI
jgi:hypothetical protein